MSDGMSKERQESIEHLREISAAAAAARRLIQEVMSNENMPEVKRAAARELNAAIISLHNASESLIGAGTTLLCEMQDELLCLAEQPVVSDHAQKFLAAVRAFLLQASDSVASCCSAATHLAGWIEKA